MSAWRISTCNGRTGVYTRRFKPLKSSPIDITIGRTNQSLTAFGGKLFPDAKTLQRVREKLSDLNYRRGNLALPANATEVERAKYQLYQLIAKYQRKHGLLQKEIADKIGVDESRVSDIVRGKLGSFTLDRLISYAQKLHPKLRVQIDAA